MFGWLWLLLFLLGLLGVVFVFVDSDTEVDTTWFWILLFVLLLLGLFWLIALALRNLRLGEPADPPVPVSGCLPDWLWLVAAFLAVLYLLGGLVWLLGDAEGAAARWTLLPIAVGLLVAGLGIWLWGRMIGSISGQVAATMWPRQVPAVLLLLVGLVAMLWWFVGGRADSIATLEDQAPVVTTGEETKPEVNEEETPGSSQPAVVIDEEKKPIEPVTEPPPDVTGTALPDDVQTLLARWCATMMATAPGGPTIEGLFPEPHERSTRPADSGPPPLIENPPAALDIMYLGASPAGCDGPMKLMVIAYLNGPPSDIQISAALDLSDDPGHVADPAGLARIAQLGGWDEFVAYDEINGLFHGDATFTAIDTPVDVDMEGNAFAFIVDYPTNAVMTEVTVQTFLRMGDTEEAATAWNSASLRFGGFDASGYVGIDF